MERVSERFRFLDRYHDPDPQDYMCVHSEEISVIAMCCQTLGRCLRCSIVSPNRQL